MLYEKLISLIKRNCTLYLKISELVDINVRYIFMVRLIVVEIPFDMDVEE